MNKSEDSRPLGLRMGYESMWSLLDDVSTEDIEKELERFQTVERELRQQGDEYETSMRRLQSKRHVLSEVIDRRYHMRLADEFELTDDHRTLVGMIYWDGMTPKFNWSDEDIADKLDWDKPNDYVSDEQAARIKRLCDELPLAIERMLSHEQ